jgi:hypothetical protein
LVDLGVRRQIGTSAAAGSRKYQRLFVNDQPHSLIVIQVFAGTTFAFSSFNVVLQNNDPGGRGAKNNNN